MELNATVLTFESQALVDWATPIQVDADSPFAAARTLARRLGAHFRPETGITEFGFWTPELTEMGIPDERVRLEILRPAGEIDFQADKQTVRFIRQGLPLLRTGDFAWWAVDGLRPGRRDQVGDFYWLTYQDEAGSWHPIRDVLAHSLPFGAFAPAELYDMAGMFAARQDAAHFANLVTEPDPDGVPRQTTPVNILQIHSRYTTKEESLAGLTQIYRRIAAKIRANEPLTPAEQNYAGYDAVQLMPTEPIVEYESGPSLWQPQEDEDDSLAVTLTRPDMTNWGYDVVMLGSSATNPALLGSKRPDEFLDFIQACHDFPGKPIMVMLDIVYGHIDNQGLPLLNRHFFAGNNMYGQNVNFRQPQVRAILLEMQRRKHDYGVDGVRVDGAQDFKWWDPETDILHYDDDYLGRMNDVEQEVTGVRYRPWMIFEDGRPWPAPDWELTSTYREVTKRLPNVYQWGPLTFAHNTPFLFTFWVSKWWRIQEIAEVGGHWITGCANHDTLRRGTQVDPEARINAQLGETLPEILRNAYDNPAAKLFDYVAMPGVPMDFINASMRAPWGFIRNTDQLYAIKVVSEEARFLDWAVDAQGYAVDDAFVRLKGLGFPTHAGLRRFMKSLDHVVQITDYDVPVMVKLLNALEPALDAAPFTVDSLQKMAGAWMDDVHDFCNVTRFEADLDPVHTGFNLAVREFRRARPWLMHDLREGEFFSRIHPGDGTVLFFGLRRAPDSGDQPGEELLFVANMEGAPRTIVPTDLPIPGLSAEGWVHALATPGLTLGPAHQPVTLGDSQGVVFHRV